MPSVSIRSVLRPIALLVFAAGASVPSCDSPTGTAAATVRVEGIVRDHATGAPIAGATVWLGQYVGLTDSRSLARTVTDADGRYSLRFWCRQEGFLDANPHRVDFVGAVAEGYSVFTRGAECVAGLQTLHLALRPR
jgi:hypothetical protein